MEVSKETVNYQEENKQQMNAMHTSRLGPAFGLKTLP